MIKHNIVNILELISSAGEEDVRDLLAEFSCSKNEEIETFLKKNAIDFAKKKMSITYLVFDEEDQLIGYFTLTHKFSVVPAEALKSNRSKEKIERYAKLDEDTKSYSVSAFLLAQLGKNYAYEEARKISGNELMDDVFAVLRKVQSMIGGGVVFLECEDKQSLLNFYQNEHNGFKPYGSRRAERENKTYRQLLRIF